MLVSRLCHAIFNFFTRIFIRCLSEAQNFSGPTVSKHEYFVIDDCNTDNRTQVAMKSNDCSQTWIKHEQGTRAVRDD